ncbi:MAG: SatD family protein [Lachnospiraceae bacterium]|nr:SatD family protein [Lachnospiraceae bacterium]
MEHYAIIGDIKASKAISNRAAVQDRLGAVLESVNQIYSRDIAANFLITLGDEFQGLLHDRTNLIEITKYIQRRMYPVGIRFGIGIGEITTDIRREAAIGADGPAFYAARAIIEEIHDQEKKLKRQAPDIQIAFYGKKPGDLCFRLTEINTLLSLTKVIEDDWTEKQRLTIWDMMENKGSQEMCAKRMGTTQPTVARRLAEGKYTVYTNALSVIEEAVRKLGEQ